MARFVNIHARLGRLRKLVAGCLVGRDFVVVVAALVVAAALVEGVLKVGTVWRTGRAAISVRGQSLADRDIDAASNVFSVEALRDAKRLIPPHDSFAAVYGQTPPLPGSFIPDAFVPYFCYWLLPRPCTTDPTAAEWVIAYHASPATLGVRFSSVVSLGPDAVLVKVRR